jgi:hypothetical protein
MTTDMQRMTRYVVAVLVGGVLGAAGCTSEVNGPIDYRVTGGFSGQGDGTLLSIEVNGAATRNAPDRRGTQTAQLPPATVDDLRTKLDDANFAALDPVYGCSCADEFIHVISVGAESGSHHTVAASELAVVPPALKTVIDTLKDIHDGPFDWH